MTSVTVSRGDVLAPSVQSRRGSIRQGAPQQAWTCASVPLGGGLCRPWGVGALGGGGAHLARGHPRGPWRAAFWGAPLAGRRWASTSFLLIPRPGQTPELLLER